jgi:hypothetical protein
MATDGRDACALPLAFNITEYSTKQKVIFHLYSGAMAEKHKGSQYSELDAEGNFVEKTCQLSVDGTVREMRPACCSVYSIS